MSRGVRTIVAMGGGGFQMEPEDRLLDDHVLALARQCSGRDTPRICLIPTATADDPTLVERFRDQIGVPPKLYARLVRFRHVLERLHRDEAALSEVALDAGYYDQAHMNAEFRALAGVSPVTFLAGRFAEGSGNTVREPSR